MRDFFKAFLKTGGGSMAAITFGIITTKVIAVLSGPAGIGIMSMLRQSQQLLVSLATVQGNTALVQGLSSGRYANKDSYLTTVASLMLGMSVLICITIWFAAPSLAATLLNSKDPQVAWLLRGLTVSVLFATGVIYVGGLLNSYRAVGRLAMMQVLGAATGALVVYPLVTWLGVPQGLLITLWGTSGVSFMAGLVFAGRAGWLDPLLQSWKTLWDWEAARYFLRFAGITVIVGLIGTGTVLLIRTMFVKHGGLDEAGIFDVAWTLSTVYIMILLGSLGTYYIPVLAGKHDLKERAELMAQVFRIVVLIGTPLITFIILGKSLIVQLLYAKEFLLALEVIQWMLIGDYFKVVAWVMAAPMLAYADLRVFLWSEAAWYSGMALGSWLALFVFDRLWLVGAIFLIMYMLYLIFCFWYAATRHGFRLSSKESVAWFAGAVVIICASLLTWNSYDVNWLVVALFLPVLIVFAWLATSRAERGSAINYLRSKS